MSLCTALLVLASPASAVNVADTAYVNYDAEVPDRPRIKCGATCSVDWDTTTAVGASLWLESNGCDGLQKQADPNRTDCPEADEKVAGERVQLLS